MRLATLLLLLAAAPAAAQEAVIARYCGGGFTGGGGGVMVDAEGRLYHLRQPTYATPREAIVVPGRPPAPVARWQALLDAARFESLPRGQPGNMTCSLTRRAHGRSHSVQWTGITTPSHLPPELRQVIEEMTAAAR